MHLASRKGPLFTKTPHVFHFFTKKHPPPSFSTFFTKNTPISFLAYGPVMPLTAGA